MSAEAARIAVEQYLGKYAHHLRDAEFDELCAFALTADCGYLPNDQLDVEKLAALVNSAADNNAAFEACSLLYERFTERSDPLPEPLAGFGRALVRGQMKPPGARARKRNVHRWRDHAITFAVYIAVAYVETAHSGGNPTKPTAAAIVSQALKHYGIYLAPGSVYRIYENEIEGVVVGPDFADNWLSVKV